jgi:hypothetical protein
MMKHKICISTAIGVCVLASQLIITGCRSPLEDRPGAGTDPGGGEQDSGHLAIRIDGSGGPGPGKGERTLLPGFQPYAYYTLNVTRTDGPAIPETRLEAGEEAEFVLEAGIWTVSAAGFIDPQNGASPFAAVRGAVLVEVLAGQSVSADLVLNRIMPDGEGYFSYAVDFPKERVDSAVLTLSALGEDGAFEPFMAIDLREEGKNEASVPLPPGYYRMTLELLGPYARLAETEVVHIYRYLETKSPRYTFTEADFPPYWEFSGTESLKKHLAALDENTPDKPYSIKMIGIDLSSIEKTGETLRTLCAALNRFVALDLSECRGDHIPSMSLTVAPNKTKIVSLVLPAAVTVITAGALSGYSALVSLEAPGVTRLEERAFRQDAALRSVYMPELVTIDSGDDAAKGAFRDCASLSQLYFPRVAFVGDFAFYNCDSLAAISLPAAVSVGKSAFRQCDALVSAELPAVESIGSYGFYNCPLLRTLTLGTVPPVLDKFVFNDSGKQVEGIFVPAEALDAYAAAAGEYWPALRDKVRPLQPQAPAE